MASARIESANDFYRGHFMTLIMTLIVMIFLLVLMVIFLMYQIENRPYPPFSAVTPKGQAMLLTAADEPNLMPNAIIKWASKAAVELYTYTFAESDAEIRRKIEPYFTPAGGTSFYNVIQRDVIATIRQNQQITYGAVNGQPVISNQEGNLTWRVQIPFLVTYRTAENASTRGTTVTLLIVKVPTTQNPVGIGIDHFTM